MKYTQKSFSSAPASDAYRENYDRIFGKKTDPGTYPEVPEGLEQQIKELHAAGDRAWADGRKFSSSSHHDEAFKLGEPYGLNPKPCPHCHCYMRARELAEHTQLAHPK